MTVRIYHEGLNVTSEVLEESVPVWEAVGWVVADEHVQDEAPDGTELTIAPDPNAAADEQNPASTSP